MQEPDAAADGADHELVVLSDEEDNDEDFKPLIATLNASMPGPSGAPGPSQGAAGPSKGVADASYSTAPTATASAAGTSADAAQPSGSGYVVNYGKAICDEEGDPTTVKYQ